ncbi:MAG TPA: ABC transporter ATP-binding protein [Actinophytocola sp.]|nr:ABC transporter ATP-binding protein [Actinophytocola sp.]
MSITGVGVGMRAGEHWLFRGLDVAAGAGECVVLTGANGTGKSTLLHCLYGLRQPTEGTVRVLGEEPDERSTAFRRQVAVLLDDSDFFAELSPRQHLELLFGAFAVDDEPAEWLAWAGLSERADVHAYHLSAGQRRRLLLLGAIARPHEVLLLDEPERALDAQGKEWLADVVAAEREADRTVVLATHHPPLLAVADHTVPLG